jgi:hypothetical protein
MFVKSNHHPADDFLLFPFTSPIPQRRRTSRPSSGRKETSTTNDIRSRREVQSDIISNVIRKSIGKHLSVPAATPAPASMSEFDDAFDIRNLNANKEQPFLFADFENEGKGNVDANFGKEEERWVAFGIKNDTNQSISYATKLSRMSMKVQIGQADGFDSEIETFEPFNDVNNRALNDSEDDFVFGPVPSVDQEETQKKEPQSSDGDKKEIEKSQENRKSHILMLATNMGMNRTQVQNQQRATMMLKALGITFETIDGSDPGNKDVRNELFKLSDMRGAYPQFFVVCEDGESGAPRTSFLGDWETIEGINDSSSLPAEILDANPTLLTWERVPGLSYRKKNLCVE